MNTQIIVFLVLALHVLGVVGTFFKRGQAAVADAAANNEPITWGKFLGQQVPDIIASLVLLVPLMIASYNADYSNASDLTLVMIAAVTSGAGIPVTASGYILSIFGAGNKTRKKNREIIDVKSNIADKKGSYGAGIR